MVLDMHSLTAEHFMTQPVEQSTHRAGNTLDVLLTNNPDLIHSHYAFSMLSDHFMV